MDDIGNLLYIILLLAFGIGKAILNANKKKEAEQRKREVDRELLDPVEVEEREPANPFQSIFERFEDQFIEEEPETVEDNIIVEETIPKKELTLKEEFEQNKQERKTEKQTRYKPKTKEEEIFVFQEDEPVKTGSYNIKELLDDQEDLKKAVILSEILNKKY